nr:immunoglobulin light chain junction region [Macaca mulatta]MOX99688.1 immunoglobulin light chain junction region [Macaca mulatta]MOY01241.1 immunoglobulin light chain junction region [Macaca mulatta]MOY03350.1 immunoglobulin light chain junction region [Macaca mulatta]MOY03674.1 immunoglobulin light chain junction region [Macaca mulatta]
CLQDIHLPLTF